MKSFAENKIIDDGQGGDEEEYIMLSLRLKSGLDFDKYRKLVLDAHNLVDKINRG